MNALLELAYERYGRLRVSVWVVLVCFGLICGSSLFILLKYVLPDVIGELAQYASTGAMLDDLWLWLTGFTGFTLTAAALLLHFGLVRAVERRQEQLLKDLSTATPREQVKALVRERDRIDQELEAVLDDNISLRGKLTQLQQLQADTQAQLVTVTGSLSEPILVADSHGRVVAASGSMCSLLAVRPAEIHGKNADSLVRLFDSNKERPREYPLHKIVEGVLDRASSIPTIQEALLQDTASKEHIVTFSSEAILQSGHVVGALLRFDDNAESDESRRPVAQASGRDSTTQLPSRNAFDSRLGELLSIAENQHATHCLMLVAVDNLQTIYDDLGYWAGEEMLWNVARLLTDSGGERAEIYRVTAIHFGVLLAFSNQHDAQRHAERLRLAVEAHSFLWNGKRLSATISIALSEITAEAGNKNNVLEDADRSLRTARDLGGNRVQTHVQDDLAIATQEIEQQLRGWLDQKPGESSRLQLQSRVLAPTPAAKDGPLIIAQLRVELQDGFWADPSAFLSSAARSGTTQDLDFWLMEAVTTALFDHPTIKERYAGVLLPLSIHSVSDERFRERFMELLRTTEPAFIIIAIPHLDAQAHGSTLQGFLDEVRSKGCRLAITSARNSTLAATAQRFSPDYVELHPSLYGSGEDALRQFQLDYAHGLSQSMHFQCIAIDKTDDDALLKAGVEFIAEEQKALGPLSGTDF